MTIGTDPGSHRSPSYKQIGAQVAAKIILPVESWLRFLVWLVIGFVIYFTNSRKNARVGQPGHTNFALLHVVTHHPNTNEELT